jgi:8-oxo-dGTP pyrophosphatase MutT (NUDIX family)
MAKVYAAVKALIEDNGKFLIIEQEFNGKKYFDLPGGKVEHGESPYNTLIREVKEEVFLDVEIVKPIGMWWFFRDSDNGQVICNTFKCKSTNLNIDLTKNPANENIINYYWLEKEKLLELKNFPNDSLKKLFELI